MLEGLDISRERLRVLIQDGDPRYRPDTGGKDYKVPPRGAKGTKGGGG